MLEKYSPTLYFMSMISRVKKYTCEAMKVHMQITTNRAPDSVESSNTAYIKNGNK